jgi:tetratricopeptide (TPR) repeat protein
LLWLRCGQPVQALLLLEQSLAECKAKQLAIWQPIPTTLLGLTLVRLGRLPEGLELLEAGIAGSEALGVRAYLALWTTHLAEGLLAAGEPDRARSVAQDALQLATRCKEQGHQAWALRLLGEIEAQGDPPLATQAESYYRWALDLAGTLGMRPLVAHCHLGLGTLCQKLGRPEQVQAELATAAEMYRAMEMSFWLEKAEAALAQVAH